MLDRQYHLYAVDTGHFYSHREAKLHDRISQYRTERHAVRLKLQELECALKIRGYSDKDIQKMKKSKTYESGGTSDAFLSQYLHFLMIDKHKKQKEKQALEKLRTLLTNKTTQNERTNGKDHVRVLNEDRLNDTDVISAFESALSRAIGIRQNELTDALVLVQVYYFTIFKDLLFFGFRYHGETYRYFTSSAGQIREKKALFIKESVWLRIEKTMMCGLTVDRINAKGGNNVNKHLAYLALTASATDEWREFDIDRAVVMEDFETEVFGTFDFVDETDYSITRKTDSVPVPHTDGAGMILPCVSAKNFMFRAPWIKGLLGVFDFRKFIREHNCSAVITDIYGKEHDLIKEDIQIIFTKSQFKMARYYDSWEEYKDCYKSFRCSAGVCNIEEDRIGNAKLNYQMLQTLTDVTDEELSLITQKSADRIRNLSRSKETMLEVLGVTPYRTGMTPFQRALKLYPALLNDTYAKDVIRDVKNSLLKKYRSGKLEVNGKYTFILPDYYAACEYWFQHIRQPEGLLQDQEVFCRLFPQHDTLDCLRSPHLYKEHAIRRNAACRSNGTRAEQIGTWFITDGIYASTHDLISKLLMYDVDGDKSLVVADPDLVAAARRNMEGIVPLYYNMKKAEPELLNRQTIYDGLCAAFTGGNIGTYSNHISKIWNSNVFISGTKEEKRQAIDCVKRLCCQNNFVIDYAKTLYKPEFPPEIKEEIAHFTNAKLPAFFAYAKDKEPSQLEKRNASLVNRIYDKIPNCPINTRGLKLDSIDYRIMMSDPHIVCKKEVASLYDSLSRKYRFRINQKADASMQLSYISQQIRESFCRLGYCEETIADMLVEYTYGSGKRYKHLLWFCFGNRIVRHLEANRNLPKTKDIQCTDCGAWTEIPSASRAIRCPRCQKEARKRINRENYLRRRNAKADTETGAETPERTPKAAQLLRHNR